ncbi:glycosyltransferase family 8 protein [Brachyspira pilosicoli]|uniref:glycosyltransferase family 8 protein n=1 Tax=Brachyspira pilosicoli TaxID=52584 RepID=UPI003005D5BF
MKEYNICFCSDNNFVPYMEALIVSILKNSLDNEKFIFHIITLNISDDNKLRLDYLKKIKKFDIFYYKPVNIDKYNKWFQEKTDRKWSVEIFFKLDIPILLSHLDKVLFLDCDMIVLDSLKELFETDLNNFYVGAVEDKYFNNSHLKKIGLDISHKYFNVGLLMLNIKEFNSNNLSDKIDSYVNNTDKLYFPEQDILNFIFHGKTKYFDYKYNFTSAIVKKHKNIENIIIPHFTLVKPLYHNTPIVKNRFYYAFWKYFIETKSFKDESLKYATILINQNDSKIAGHNKLIDKLSWWIPSRKMRNNFKTKYKRDIKEKFE